MPYATANQRSSRPLKVAVLLALKVAVLLAGFACSVTISQETAEVRNQGVAVNRLPVSMTHTSDPVLQHRLIDKLNALICQFQRIDTLTFTADVCILMLADDGSGQPPGPGETACGVIRFSGADVRYRYTSIFSPAEYPGLDTDIAFDGELFQIRLANRTLIRSKRHTETLLPLPPNPLFELLQYRYPLTDENSGHEIRWSSVRNDPLPQLPIEKNARQGEEQVDRLARFIALPGGVLNGEPYKHHVYFDDPGIHAPTRIERVSVSGRLLTVAEFRDYRQVDGCGEHGYWPQAIRLTAYGDNHQPAAVIDYRLSDFDVNAPVPSEVFSISTSDAQRIWDEPVQ